METFPVSSWIFLGSSLRCPCLLSTKWKKANYIWEICQTSNHGKERNLCESGVNLNFSDISIVFGERSLGIHHGQFLLLLSLCFSYLQYRKGNWLDKLLCSKSCIQWVWKCFPPLFRKLIFSPVKILLIGRTIHSVVLMTFSWWYSKKNFFSVSLNLQDLRDAGFYSI